METVNLNVEKSNILRFKKGLYVVATPIGNKYDITLRAIKTFQISNVIACEDTKVTKNLFKLLKIDIHNKLWLTYNDHHSGARKEVIIKQLGEGKIVSLVSDAGTPLISDPGYKLVKSVIKKGHRVYSIPGPCAAISSLVISGFKTNRFCFLGFLPKNKNDFVSILRNYASLGDSLIIYEKAKRLYFFLTIINDNFFRFKLAIVRELTKIYEEVMFIDNSNIKSYNRFD